MVRGLCLPRTLGAAELNAIGVVHVMNLMQNGG